MTRRQGEPPTLEGVINTLKEWTGLKSPLQHSHQLDHMEFQLEVADALDELFIKKITSEKEVQASLSKVAVLLSGMLQKGVFPDGDCFRRVFKILSSLHDVENALKFREIAVSHGLGEVISYAANIKVIANSKKPNVEEALQYFEEAKTKGNADMVTYMAILDVLYAKSLSSKSYTEKAYEILNEAILKFNLVDLRVYKVAGNKAVDLHGLTPGMVYFSLTQLLENEIADQEEKQEIASPKIYKFNYGKGKHTKGFNEVHPLKQALNQVAKEFRDRGISGNENKSDASIFQLNIGPASATQHQPASNHSGAFFETKKQSDLSPQSPPWSPTMSSPATSPSVEMKSKKSALNPAASSWTPPSKKG